MVEAVCLGDSFTEGVNGSTTIGRPRIGARPVAEQLPTRDRLIACRCAKGILSVEDEDQLGAEDGEGCEGSGE